ncbi:hypothetical protein [Geobacter sp. SVR]|uniref:hypothetical protein n=1 Tax=Geobacter sp. SVR TaxID=2495594 RepID=UPI00143EF79C|nr:hypothetical protein [Geobacter sp. SVR]BCS52862.1 hypothetical protein GSVR_11700 [Geobacter sp. SVR]GCF86730.1 hypothetical protein GSbR_33300 [Geobacter sp. SVR]
MKRLTFTAAILTVSLAALLKPGGVGGEMWVGQQDYHPDSKDSCLIVAINCVSYDESLQERINRLNTEISKGRDVYDADELAILRQKLDKTYQRLDESRPSSLFNPGYP